MGGDIREANPGKDLASLGGLSIRNYASFATQHLFGLQQNIFLRQLFLIW